MTARNHPRRHNEAVDTMKDMISKPTLLRLVCKNCDIAVDLRVLADDKTDWPLHKCRKTHRAEPFSTVIGVPKVPVREFPPDEPSQPVSDPYPYLKVIG